MKKIVLLIPLMLFSIFENSYCMHKKYKNMKKGGRKHEKSFYKLDKKRKRKIKSKKVKKRQELDFDTFSDQKKPSIFSSFVPRINFSFGKKNLISTVILLYMIFGQILANRKAYGLNVQVTGVAPGAYVGHMENVRINVGGVTYYSSEKQEDIDQKDDKFKDSFFDMDDVNIKVTGVAPGAKVGHMENVVITDIDTSVHYSSPKQKTKKKNHKPSKRKNTKQEKIKNVKNKKKAKKSEDEYCGQNGRQILNFVDSSKSKNLENMLVRGQVKIGRSLDAEDLKVLGNVKVGWSAELSDIKFKKDLATNRDLVINEGIVFGNVKAGWGAELSLVEFRKDLEIGRDLYLDKGIVFGNVRVGWGAKLKNKGILHKNLNIGRDLNFNRGIVFGNVKAGWGAELNLIEFRKDLEIGRDLYLDKGTVLGNVKVGWGAKLKNKGIFHKNLNIGRDLNFNKGAVLGNVKVGWSAKLRDIKFDGDLTVGRNLSIEKGIVSGKTTVKGRTVNIKNGCKINDLNVHAVKTTIKSSVVKNINVKKSLNNIKNIKNKVIGGVTINNGKLTVGGRTFDLAEFGGGFPSISNNGGKVFINGKRMDDISDDQDEEENEKQIVILNGATVEGNIVFESEEGEVILQNGASVGGEIIGGKIIETKEKDDTKSNKSKNNKKR
ncbi:hypothetical protein ACFLYU_04495 [Candidatus Dependentiae bacterium]